MYLSQQINEVLESNKNRFLGCNSYSAIVRRLGMSFGFPKDLKFRYEQFNDIDEEEFTVSGLYDMTTNKKYVILNFSDTSDKITLNSFSFNQFKFFVSQTIQHETIHQDQWQYRDGTEDPVKLDFRHVVGSLSEEREYLSDIDEIDAYGHDIAMEIKYFYPKDDPFNVLKNINKKRKIPSYGYYKHTFKNTSWSKVKKRLLSKTYKWIPYV